MEERRDKEDTGRGGKWKEQWGAEREARKEEQKNRGGRRRQEVDRGNGEPEGQNGPGLKELHLAGPGGGASSPSLMAVK